MQKLLLIDSNEKYLKTMQRYLSWHKFDVEILEESSEALNLIASNEYDLIICDAFSEPIDGFSLAKTIRNNSQPRISQKKILIIAEEEVALEKRIFLRKNNIYFMSKYKNTEKWIEKINAILQR